MNINDLTIPQLQQTQETLQSEIDHLTGSFEKIRQIQLKFQEAGKIIKEVSEGAKDGQDLLVPLTSSLYVPGKIMDKSKFLVDIGTGYFVEKNSENGQAFFKSKTTKLDQNLTDLEKIVTEKSQNLRVVQEVLKSKLQAAQASNPRPNAPAK